MLKMIFKSLLVSSAKSYSKWNPKTVISRGFFFKVVFEIRAKSQTLAHIMAIQKIKMGKMG